MLLKIKEEFNGMFQFPELANVHEHKNDNSQECAGYESGLHKALFKPREERVHNQCDRERHALSIVLPPQTTMYQDKKKKPYPKKAINKHCLTLGERREAVVVA